MSFFSMEGKTLVFPSCLLSGQIRVYVKDGAFRFISSGRRRKIFTAVVFGAAGRMKSVLDIFSGFQIT